MRRRVQEREAAKRERHVPDVYTVSSRDRAETRRSDNSRNRRQWPRFSIAIPIEVSGLDGGGEPFCERVMSMDVSEWGQGFNFRFALEMDSFVMARVIEGVCALSAEWRAGSVSSAAGAAGGRRLPGGRVEDGRRAAVVRRAT